MELPCSRLKGFTSFVDKITYHTDRKISADQFIDLLRRSTLAERRPVGDGAKIEKMLAHGDILVTAWSNDLLIGVSRALSDFSFCCYFSKTHYYINLIFLH